MDTINRLQFRHHDEIFETREDALKYICQTLPRDGGEGLAEQGSPYTRSLFAEPTILRYKNTDEEGTCETCNKGPHIILVIGSQTNDEELKPEENKYCIIDIDKTEDEIKNLEEELEKAIRSLTLIAFDTPTLDIHVDKTEDGTFISGDVKTAETHIFENEVKGNNLMAVPFDDAGGSEGLFIYVDLTYDEITETFTFVVSNADGTLKKTSVKLPNNYVTGGVYDIKDESIHLHMRNGDEVVIDCQELIDEWYADSGATTPVILTRDRVYGDTPHHNHADRLWADVRLVDSEYNILEKTEDNRKLFVDGRASNIKYNNSNVAEQLDRIKLNPDVENIIFEGSNGFSASVNLDYVPAENKLVFKKTSVNGGETIAKTIQLNSLEFLDDITYDQDREVIIIRYVDSKGNYKTVEIPAKDIIEEWKVDNENHSVELVKTRNAEDNKDILTADAKIHVGNNNILEDLNHELYVNGISDNIKYDVTGNTTVKNVLDNLSGITNSLNEKIDQEITDRTADVERIDNTIGSGFTTDSHETITYKFEQLQDKVNEEASKLQAEINRSTSADTVHDGRLDAIDAEIGDGFSSRNTVRDEIDSLQSEIEAVSADSSSRLSDVINEDHSINVETRNDENNKPTIKVVKTNLSEEVEDNKPNIIKLNADGLYAGVDLIYEFNEEVGTNQLIFKTTNGTKVYDLKTNSVVDKIYYDPNREAIIIEYTVNGHRMPDVVIPVGDLINEWRVEDGHPHAVQLEKVRVASGTSEQDVLKASVIITDDHDDNILVMDDGALYVSGSGITANKAEIDALKERMNTAENDIDVLQDGLSAEIARAMGVEEDLKRDLTTAQENIANEILRATSEEQRIETNLDNEISRSTQKDQQLTDTLNQEITRATSAETALNTKIDVETTRATGEEQRIETKLDNEISRSTNKDNELQTELNGVESDLTNEISRAINVESGIVRSLTEEVNRAKQTERDLEASISGETVRATTQEANLLHLIEDEAERRASGDTVLNTLILGEITRAENVESDLLSRINTEKNRVDTLQSSLSTTNSNLNDEIVRSTHEDERLYNLISAETQTREESDRTLSQALANATKTFESTSCISASTDANNVVRHYVNIAGGAGMKNIVKCDGGLYATVELSYDPATNKIKLITSDGESEPIQLVGASLLENLYYDSTNKELVITYKDATGESHTVKFGVSELFNDWDVDQNSSVGMKLYKVEAPVGSGEEDRLYGEVLISNHPDNALVLDGNHLYVSSSAMTHAEEVAECVKQELKIVENELLGMPILTECGEGSDYIPNQNANYIASATSFNNADFILDKEIKNVNDEVTVINQKIDSVSANTECVDGKADAISKLMFGTYYTLPSCGEGAEFPTNTGCIISAATSLYHANMLLDEAFCNMKDKWFIYGFDTPTTHTDWKEIGQNRHMLVDARLSHGNLMSMNDDDFTISGKVSAFTESISPREVSDTNVLRIIDIKETNDGLPLNADNPYNGLYLSNIWDCGIYYDEVVDADAITTAQEAGYITDPYRTDTASTASNYNYGNYVRQDDI